MHIYTSPRGEVSVPNCTLTEWLFCGLSERAWHTVLTDGPTGRSYSGAQTMEMIRAIAGGIAQRGLGDGAVTAIMAPNIPEYVAVFHGVAYAGGTITTLNPTYTADEVRQQLTDSGAALLVTVAPFFETARAGAEGTAVREIVVIGAAPEGGGATPLDGLMGPPLDAHAPIDPATHVVVLPYSSGTTGLPKGVMLTHRNMVANLEQLRGLIEIAPGETTVAFLPFFHIYAMTVVMNYFPGRGGALVTMPRFEMEPFLGAVQTHRVRQLYVVPPVLLGLMQHPLVAQSDLSSLEMIVSAAAPLGAQTTQQVSARLGCLVSQGYGMTEMSPVSHFSDMGGIRDGSVGQAVAGTEVRIVDAETGQDAAPGAPGEVWVRGPQVMAGYLGRPDATAQTMEGDWLRTGDLGRVDGDGYLFILDRIKELIKVKGFPVAPAELEAVLLALPGVADAAVIGIPDEQAGEVPVAFLVPAAGATIDTEELHAHFEAHLAHYKRLHRIEIVDSIPKSPSGKILRRLLRQPTAA